MPEASSIGPTRAHLGAILSARGRGRSQGEQVMVGCWPFSPSIHYHMGAEALSDERIKALLSMKKRLTSSSSPKPRLKGKHEERDYTIVGDDGETRFVVYARQNANLTDDFSCGLRWEAPSGESVTLIRMNGPSHVHPNRLEKTSIVAKCHVHMATTRYIQAGLQPEGYAEESFEYTDLEGALRVLARVCNVDGFHFTPHQMTLPQR